MLRSCLLSAGLTMIVTAMPLVAQGETTPPEGHSHNGHVFNEGPRQRAVLIEGCGKVDFGVSSKNELARKFFDQGLAQLHGYWYFEAERSFRQCAALDPDCAMAYWGMAMANTGNASRRTAFGWEAYKRRNKASARERWLIESYARYWDSMKDPDAEDPSSATATAGDKGIGAAANADAAKGKGRALGPGAAASKGKAAGDASDDEATDSSAADADSERDSEREPGTRRDPARQRRRRRPSRAKQDRLYADLEEYLIHYDDIEVKALLVNQWYLDRGTRGSMDMKEVNESLLQDVFAVAPMHPAHHYRIHLWDKKATSKRSLDSAWKSGHAGPAIAHMWHMGGHVYAKLDRHADAAWVQEASARVDHAQMMRFGVMPFEIHNYAHNNSWLCRSLRHVGRIHDSVDLAKNMIELPRHPKKRDSSARGGRRALFETLASAEMWQQLAVLRGGPYDEEGAFETGVAFAMLGQIDRARAFVRVEERKAKAPARTRGRLARGNQRAQRPRRSRSATRGNRGKQLAALIDLNIARHKQDKAAIDAALTKLDKSGYSRRHLAVLSVECGDHERALRVLPTRGAKGIAIPIAIRAWVQHSCGEKAKAKRSFEELRALSARFDLDVPVFARLAPLAKELGYDDDWRLPYATPKDVGKRPDLSTLGPFRWAPTAARDWKLPQGVGPDLSLRGYRGKPVLVVFFLGFGCVHCVQQLDALKPMVDDFRKAGIEIVSIGTDDQNNVRASLQGGMEDDDEPITFPICCDPKGEVFKQWRCWDDFEDMALHGTFLVDAQGRVRWQDISFEPFMDTAWLLKECKRLLALPAPK